VAPRVVVNYSSHAKHVSVLNNQQKYILMLLSDTIRDTSFSAHCTCIQQKNHLQPPQVRIQHFSLVTVCVCVCVRVCVLGTMFLDFHISSVWIDNRTQTRRQQSVT
jgi:hypothetical protein